MNVVPINAANIDVMLQNDANQMRTFIQWVQARNSIYSQNLTVANMTTAGIDAPTQTIILAFVADLSRLVTFTNGTLPGVASNITFDLNNILGIM